MVEIGDIVTHNRVVRKVDKVRGDKCRVVPLNGSESEAWWYDTKDLKLNLRLGGMGKKSQGCATCKHTYARKPKVYGHTWGCNLCEDKKCVQTVETRHKEPKKGLVLDCGIYAVGSVLLNSKWKHIKTEEIDGGSE